MIGDDCTAGADRSAFFRAFLENVFIAKKRTSFRGFGNPYGTGNITRNRLPT
jgi:hypothetical protein